MKVSLFFKWAYESCPTAAYILKTDDDSFVRIDSFVTKLIDMPRFVIRFALFFSLYKLYIC